MGPYCIPSGQETSAGGGDRLGGGGGGGGDRLGGGGGDAITLGGGGGGDAITFGGGGGGGGFASWQTTMSGVTGSGHFHGVSGVSQ